MGFKSWYRKRKRRNRIRYNKSKSNYYWRQVRRTPKFWPKNMRRSWAANKMKGSSVDMSFADYAHGSKYFKRTIAWQKRKGRQYR